MNETTNENQDAAKETTAHEDKTCKGCSSACSQLPLIVALVALALAAYASFAPRQNGDLVGQIQQLNNEVADLKQRLETLNMNSESSRDAHVRMQLQRVLLDIEGAKSMASPDMKPALEQAADQIRQLVEPGTESAPTVNAEPAMTGEAAADTAAEAESSTADGQNGDASEQQDIPTVEVPAFSSDLPTEEPVAPEAAQ